VDDHADAIGVVLDRGMSGLAYNVPGEGPERTNRVVTELVLEALGKPWSLVRAVPDRAGHDRRYALDGRRIQGLGWLPRVTFEDGLRRTVAWYAEHDDWWRSARDHAFDDYYQRQYAWRLEQSSEA
jgi:dTDP-glucose 4,6-dehydratase